MITKMDAGLRFVGMSLLKPMSLLLLLFFSYFSVKASYLVWNSFNKISIILRNPSLCRKSIGNIKYKRILCIQSEFEERWVQWMPNNFKGVNCLLFLLGMVV